MSFFGKVPLFALIAVAAVTIYFFSKTKNKAEYPPREAAVPQYVFSEPRSSIVGPEADHYGADYKYVKIARTELGARFSHIVPPGVDAVVSHENGKVLVTYPFNPVREDGLFVLGPDYHVQFEIDPESDKVIAIRAGS